MPVSLHEDSLVRHRQYHSSMARSVLCLIISILLIQLGHCYVPVEKGEYPATIPTQTSCRVDAIDIGLTDDMLQCFPEPTTDEPNMAEDGTICLLPRPVQGMSGLAVDETFAVQCVNGRWTDGNPGKEKIVVKRFLGSVGRFFRKAWRDVKNFFGGGDGDDDGGGGGGGRTMKSPTFKDDPCTPSDLEERYYVESGQDSAVVTWTEPEAQDSDGPATSLSVELVTSQPSGSRFEGNTASGKQHHIRYKATDSDGLSAYCNFNFSVIILSCDTAPWPNNGQRNCSQYAHLGSVCTYDCNLGYEVSGNSQITCQGDNNPDWTSTPTCTKVVCPEPPSLDNGVVSCSSPNYEYTSVCRFACNTHYTLSSSITSIQCRAGRTWTSSEWPTCIDAAPPTLTTITPQLFYADRGSNSTSVEWHVPTAVDLIDPNPVVTQTEGQTYGSSFQVGSSIVKYKATDSQGNESPESIIEIRILETECQHPLDILNDTNILFDCATDSYTFGTECTLSCKFDIPQVGTDRITCERNESSSDLTTGYWSWGDGVMPFCNQTDCPTPEAPNNGSMIVGYVGKSKVITMQCRDSHDIPNIEGTGFTGQLVCKTDGTYSPLDDLPDCSESYNVRAVRLPAQLYYSGNCEDDDTKAIIKSKTENILKTSIDPVLRSLCPDVNNCTTSNLDIVCGDTTGRKRRDEPNELPIQEKRQVSRTLRVKFDIIAFVEQDLDSLDAVVLVDTLLSDTVIPRLNELVADGALDIDGFERESDSLDAPKTGNLVCSPGSVLKTVSCLTCPQAYFHNTSSDKCELCPIGHFSDEHALTSCKPCPSGFTTTSVGCKHEGQCVEQCPAGRYSTTGAVPCTSCPIGSYQSGTGQTSCVKCTTGTTSSTGSLSSTACQEFQLLVNGGNGIVTTQTFSADMANATLAFWVKSSDSETSDVTIRLTSEGNHRISVYLTDAIRVEVPGTQFNRTIGDLTGDSWIHVAIEVDNTNNNVITYTNGQMHSSESFGTNLPQPFVSMGTFEILTTSNAGVKIADLHLEDVILTPVEISSLTSSCWTEKPNTVFSMDDFRDTTLPGVHIQTPLSCDPIDECASNPCNNFTCVNGINTYTCYCSGGWSGISCETPPDFCVDHGCSNGATCVNGNTGYTCLCPPRYSGDLCITEQVDGGWSDYTEWTECSATCNGGTQSRTRTCDNPVPSNNGANCTGNAMETRACNTELCIQCPAFPRVYGGSPNCTEDSVTGLMSCLHQCRPGYVLPPEFVNEVYTCGTSTNNEWLPMANVPSCQKAGAPSRYAVNAAMSYDREIQETDKTSVEEEVTDNLSDIPCLQSNTCNASVELMESKRKRSTDSTIVVTLSVDITETGDLDIEGYIENGTVSTTFQELIDGINGLTTAASYINTSSSSIFDVTVNGVTYSSSQSTLTLSGTVTCPDGQTATDGVCASCPEGTYYVDGYCSFCEKGAYSSSAGQTACTSCPYGYTTASIGSNNISQCNVNEATTAEYLTSVPTNSTEGSSTVTTTTTTATASTDSPATSTLTKATSTRAVTPAPSDSPDIGSTGCSGICIGIIVVVSILTFVCLLLWIRLQIARTGLNIYPI